MERFKLIHSIKDLKALHFELLKSTFIVLFFERVVFEVVELMTDGWKKFLFCL